MKERLCRSVMSCVLIQRYGDLSLTHVGEVPVTSADGMRRIASSINVSWSGW